MPVRAWLQGNSASASSLPAGLADFLAKLEHRISQLENIDAEPAVPIPAVAPANDAAGADGLYIMNRDTGVWHQVNSPEPEQPQHKKSRCGWLFATRKFVRSNSLPPGVPRLPAVRELALHLDLSDIE